METESRTINTKRNLVSGLIKQLINIILPFLVRTALIYTLGELYQGLSGLLSSILQMLSLAELGFSTVVIYILYKPIAENNIIKICSILNFLKKIYKYVGLTILIVGLSLLPFLNLLINGDYPNDINIYIVYMLYLVNSSLSYFFFAYKSALLTALQKDYLVSNIYTITSICSKILQIISIIVFQNYYYFVVSLIIGTLVNNLLVQYYSRKYYPRLVAVGNIDTETKFLFKKQVKGIVINRLADTARNSFDNIILSAVIGLTTVAIYDNYYYIYSAIYGVTLAIIHAMQASVGNSLSIESVDKNYNDLKKFTFIFMWFVGWCFTCLLVLYQPFMSIWMKDKPYMLLDDYNVILFCIYFYAITMNNTRNLYTNGNGLFWELRIWYIAEALGNLILNFVLGYYFGVTGVLIATIITIFAFNFITRTNVLFNIYFKMSPKQFYCNHFKYFVATIFVSIITYYTCSFVLVNSINGLLIKFAVCLFLPNLLYFLIYFRSSDFKTSLILLRSIIIKN